MQNDFQIVLLDCGSQTTSAIDEALKTLRNYRIDIIQLASARLLDFNAYGALIISGGPLLFTDTDHGYDLADQFTFLKKVTIPVLGICLGHQALALQWGGSIYRDVERRGEEWIRFSASHELLRGFEHQALFREDHCEGVKVSADFQVLGHSQYYPAEIIAAKGRPHFGVQFHPEVSGENGVRLLDNFLTIAESHVLSPYESPSL